VVVCIEKTVYDDVMQCGRFHCNTSAPSFSSSSSSSSAVSHLPLAEVAFARKSALHFSAIFAFRDALRVEGIPLQCLLLPGEDEQRNRHADMANQNRYAGQMNGGIAMNPTADAIIRFCSDPTCGDGGSGSSGLGSYGNRGGGGGNSAHFASVDPLCVALFTDAVEHPPTITALDRVAAALQTLPIFGFDSNSVIPVNKHAALGAMSAATSYTLQDQYETTVVSRDSFAVALWRDCVEMASVTDDLWSCASFSTGPSISSSSSGGVGGIGESLAPLSISMNVFSSLYLFALRPYLLPSSHLTLSVS
jgi:hypothetical protein